MTRSRKGIVAFLAVALLLAVFSLLPVLRNNRPAPCGLSVVFVGMTNDPVGQMSPIRIAVPVNATGLCALLMVTNTGTNGSFRFCTASVERATKQGWEQYDLTNAWLHELLPIGQRLAVAESRAGGTAWRGIDGWEWSPRYGCLFAVAWPPGLPTNSAWRMRLRCAREPAGLRGLINRELAREVFPPGRECAVYSSEVVY